MVTLSIRIVHIVRIVLLLVGLNICMKPLLVGLRVENRTVDAVHRRTVVYRSVVVWAVEYRTVVGRVLDKGK